MFLLLACILPGCAAPSRFRDAERPLERSILLVEECARGQRIDLSAAPGVTGPVDSMGAARVPDPAQVDAGSTIRVNVQRSGLMAAPRPPAAASDPEVLDETGALRARLGRLSSSLLALERFAGARTAAFAEYAHLEALPDGALDKPAILARFMTLKRAYGGAQEALLDTLGAVWPEGDAGYQRMEDALGQLEREPDLFYEFLQGELDAVRGELTLVEQRAKSRDMTLRLESFLYSPGKDPTAIHLEGYDLLPQGRVELLDPWGLALTERQLADLTELTAASRELADIAERVDSGQAGLLEAFDTGSTAAVQRIGRIVSRGDSLLALLAEPALRARFAALESAFRALSNEVADTLAARGRMELRAEAQALGSALPDLMPRAQTWRQAVLLMTHLPSLRAAESRSGGFTGLVTWVTAARDTVAKVSRLDASLSESVLLLARLRDDMTTRMEALADRSDTAITEMWRASEARRETEELLGLVRGVRAASTRLGFIVAGFSAPPPTATLDAPDALDVPLDKVTNTAIDLWRTPREEGDYVTLRATLKHGDQVVDQSLATFMVRRFGWHAEFAPSVVAVRPENVKEGSDRSRFEASLSWLATYTPRASETSVASQIVALLEPSLGPHAVFLNFDEADLDQIGLGLTLGLRRGLLQGGVGWNILSGDSAPTSRRYVFVGSSLIPVLQAMGLKKD